MKQHRCLSDQLLSTRCMILQLYACIIVSEMNSIGPGSTDNRWSPRARLWKGLSDRPYLCTDVSVSSACRAWVDRGSMGASDETTSMSLGPTVVYKMHDSSIICLHHCQ